MLDYIGTEHFWKSAEGGNSDASDGRGCQSGREGDFPSSDCHAVVFTTSAAAKSLQSCPTVRPHRWQPTRLPRPWDSPGKNTGVGCHFLLQCMKVKGESEVAQSYPTLGDPMDCSLPGSSSMGFSRQEYWSGVPLPSPAQPLSLVQFFATQWTI